MTRRNAVFIVFGKISVVCFALMLPVLFDYFYDFLLSQSCRNVNIVEIGDRERFAHFSGFEQSLESDGFRIVSRDTCDIAVTVDFRPADEGVVVVSIECPRDSYWNDQAVFSVDKVEAADLCRSITARICRSVSGLEAIRKVLLA